MSELQRGNVYVSLSHGLIQFERFDTYRGQVTAQFQILEHGQDKCYLLLDALHELKPFEVDNERKPIMDRDA